MRGLRFLLLLVSIIALAGCAPDEVVVGGKPRPRMYQTIVSLSPSTTEIAGTHASTITMVGRTESCNFPVNVTSAKVVMRGVTPNYEEIASIRPSVVVYDRSIISESEAEKIKQLGIETFEFSAKSVDEFKKQLYEFAALVGAENTIMAYVQEIELSEANASGVAPAQKPRIAFIIPGERGDHMIAGTKSFLADVARIAGGETVGPDSDKFEPANIESLISMNPQVILCAEGMDKILGDARLQSIDAVKSAKTGEQTIVQVKSDVMLRQGARVNGMITLVSRILGGLN